MGKVVDTNWFKLARGLFISCILTFILLFLYAVLLTYTGIGENTMVPVIILITAVSILVR